MSRWLIVLLLFLLLALLVWAADRWMMNSGDLTEWDQPADASSWQRFSLTHGVSAEHQAIADKITEDLVSLKGLSMEQRIERMREGMDELGREGQFESTFMEVAQQGVKGEWVIAPGADRTRRVLYIHGGAFIAGSPLSHRSITSRLSRATDAAVFSVDYRLMPEHSRMTGVEDVRNAYLWVMQNGPDGAGDGDILFMGGDSAGGNLVLSLAHWLVAVRQPLPRAIFAFSPVVDSTFTAPSIRENFDSDTLLGPLFRPLLNLSPRLVRLGWMVQNRMHPMNPVASPIFSDFRGLPPVLIQVSESEILFSDAMRYVNKARASGVDAKLQSWPGLLHAWQIFQPGVPESNQAWAELDRWFQSIQSTGSPN